MKCDVELSLPRKKEIIMYATMTDHQKKFQEHLVNHTLEAHLGENGIRGTCSSLCLIMLFSALLCSSLLLQVKAGRESLTT